MFIKKMINDISKYWHYLRYYIKAINKDTVSNTSLGVLWWFLDPLLNIGIYVILVRVVFSQRDPNFPVFFFSAMLVWRYFSMMVQQNADSIFSNVSLCQDVYIPKLIFPLARCISGLIPFLASLGILVIMLILFKIPFTWNLLYLPLLIVILFFFTLAISIISAHISVFLSDFQNILPHIITIGMFATPIFYDIDRVPAEYHFWFKLNPVAILTISFRNIIAYGIHPPIKSLITLIIVTIVVLFVGIYLLYKYDQVYNRVRR